MSIGDGLVILLLVGLALLGGGVLLAARLCLGNPLGRRALLRLYARAPGGHSGLLGLGVYQTTIVFLVSIAVGLLGYGHLVYGGYVRLQDAYCAADALRELFDAEAGAEWPSTRNAESPRLADRACQSSPIPTGRKLSLEHLHALLGRLNLLDAKETTPQALLAADSRNYRVAAVTQASSFPYQMGQPTIDLVLALATYPGASQCTSCPDECKELQRTALAAALAQAPSQGWRLHSVPVGERLIAESKRWGLEPSARAAEAACAPRLRRALRSLQIGSYLPFGHGVIFERPRPETSPQRLAEMVVGWHGGVRATFERAGKGERRTFVQEQAVLRLISGLMVELRGAPEVRSERRWVNAIIGWERCSLVMLAFVFAIFLASRYLQRLPFEIQHRIITDELAFMHREWLKAGTRPDALERQRRARNVAEHLETGRVPVDHGNVEITTKKKKEQGHIVTAPLNILRAAIDEMQFHVAPNGGQNVVDSRFVETVAEGERRKLARSRTLMDAMLPTFPAIGFVGTVSSLLVAMSMADRIVSTEEPLAKGAAAASVTDVLSLCFSTTLIALLCVLIFSPIALLQATQEDRLIDDTEHHVQTVLRPEQP